MSQYIPEQYEHSAGDLKVELDPSNYIMKADLKEATRNDRAMLASKSDHAGLETKVNNLIVYQDCSC